MLDVRYIIPYKPELHQDIKVLVNLPEEHFLNFKEVLEQSEKQNLKKSQYQIDNQKCTISTSAGSCYPLLDKAIRFSLSKNIDVTSLPSMLADLVKGGALPMEKALALQKIILPALDLTDVPLKDVKGADYIMISNYWGN